LANGSDTRSGGAAAARSKASIRGTRA
jgi:hypothetical protein